MDNYSSIDKDELKKFDTIANKWWDVNGEFKILHDINPLRIKYIQEKIRSHFKLKNKNSIKKIKLLDIGCGGGLVSSELCKLGIIVTALDASANNISVAKNYAKHNKLSIKYLNCTAEELVAQNEKFDVVLCLEVIEHISNPQEFVANITKLMAPQGMLIISTINRSAKSYMLAIIMAEYILGWVPKGTHDYNKFVKPSELNNFLEPHRLSLIELKGLIYDLCSKNWQLSSDVDVNYFAYITN